MSLNKSAGPIVWLHLARCDLMDKQNTIPLGITGTCVLVGYLLLRLHLLFSIHEYSQYKRHNCNDLRVHRLHLSVDQCISRIPFESYYYLLPSQYHVNFYNLIQIYMFLTNKTDKSWYWLCLLSVVLANMLLRQSHPRYFSLSSKNYPSSSAVKPQASRTIALDDFLVGSLGICVGVEVVVDAVVVSLGSTIGGLVQFGVDDFVVAGTFFLLESTRCENSQYFPLEQYPSLL